MFDGKQQLTLEELMGGDLESRLETLPIDALLDVSVDDTLMLTVAYGAANRYTIVGDGVVMNPIVYTFNGNTAYDDRGNAVAATVTTATQSGFAYELTFADQSKQYIKLVDGEYVAFSQNGNDFEEVLYPKHTVGDLQGDMAT